MIDGWKHADLLDDCFRYTAFREFGPSVQILKSKAMAPVDVRTDICYSER